jgi:uncharacterized protein
MPDIAPETIPGPVPGNELGQAIEQFNTQEFYACHDTLEALWVAAPVPEKKFYQGLLQIAVACHHLGNSNWRGATIMLGEGRFRLRDYEPAYQPDDQSQNVDIEHIRNSAAALLADLQAIQPEEVTQFLLEFTNGQRFYPAIKIITT